MAGFVDGGRRILSHFVSDSPGFVAPYVHAGPARPPVRPVGASDEDPLFADAAVDLATLRQRAYNYRWAVQPPGVIPLTAADPDFPVCEEIIAAVQRHLGAGYVPYGPSEGLPELRHVATDTLLHRHGLRCGPDTLFPTDGAASAVFLVARFALPVPGDEAIIPEPVDFLLERSVRAAGGVVRRWPTAGMRLGLPAAPDPAQRRQIMALAHAEDTAYGTSTISQVAGAAADELGDEWLERFVAHLRRRRDQAVARLAAIPGVRCAVPEGTFFGPGAADHLRLSFATSRGILAEGLDRMAAGLRSACADRRVRSS